MIIFNKLVEMKKRKKYTSGFKTKVVLEALQERETIQELAKKYDLHPTQISTWKSQFLSSASDVFEKGIVKDDDEKEKTELFKKVGQLQMEVDFLKKVLGK
jgi:transposase